MPTLMPSCLAGTALATGPRAGTFVYVLLGLVPKFRYANIPTTKMSAPKKVRPPTTPRTIQMTALLELSWSEWRPMADDLEELVFAGIRLSTYGNEPGDRCHCHF